MFGEPGERIAYSVHEGPASAPAMMLVHGLTASRASFLTNIEGLSRHFTVVSTELLGHGDSDSPRDKLSYRPEAACERLIGLADELGLGRFFLCGHSLGGALALRVALDQPRRLRGLIVINSNSAAGSPKWHADRGPALAELGARAVNEGMDFIKRTRLYPAASKRLPADAKNALATSFDEMEPHAFAHTGTELSARVSSWARLGELRVPTLVVAGTRDRLFMENLPAMLAEMPSDYVQAVELEGAGHAANLEQPAEFEAVVVAFAESLV